MVAAHQIRPLKPVDGFRVLNIPWLPVADFLDWTFSLTWSLDTFRVDLGLLLLVSLETEEAGDGTNSFSATKVRFENVFLGCRLSINNDKRW